MLSSSSSTWLISSVASARSYQSDKVSRRLARDIQRLGLSVGMRLKAVIFAANAMSKSSTDSVNLNRSAKAVPRLLSSGSTIGVTSSWL